MKPMLILRNRYLYLINFCLLITHEIDSAYWQEWELFHLPGGIQLFLIFNLVLVALSLLGLLLLWDHKREGLYFAVTMAATGIFAFGIHLFFILTGNTQFTLPVSMALLGLILIASLLQGVVAVRTLRPAKRRKKKVVKESESEELESETRVAPREVEEPVI